MEELFHFRVHCGSSDNHFFEPAAQCVHQFLADLSVYLSVQQRDAEGPFHGLFVDDGLNDILVYLFDNEGDGDYQVWFYFFERFHQNFWRGHFAQQCDVRTHSRSGQEVEGATIGMRQGQERQHLVSFFQ